MYVDHGWRHANRLHLCKCIPTRLEWRLFERATVQVDMSKTVGVGVGVGVLVAAVGVVFVLDAVLVPLSTMFEATMGSVLATTHDADAT